MKRFIVLVFLAASLSALGAGVELRPQAIETCTSCRMLWADFNGDGLDDVIEGKGLQFNLGGRFGPRIAVSRIGSQDGLAGAAHFNRDAFADVVVYRENGADLLLLSNGTGSFREVKIPGQNGNVMEVLDFDGDGLGDLVQWKPGQLTLQRGTGNGAFALHQTFAWGDSYTPMETPPATVDLNGDGRTDFILKDGGSLLFHYGQPDGRFVREERYVRFGPRGLTTGDLNGDGHLDIAMVAYAETQPVITALFGDGAGHFPRVSRFAVPPSSGADYGTDVNNLVVGDFIAGGGQELMYGRHDGVVVVMSGVNGHLREVARTTVAGRNLHLVSARFRAAQPEVIARGNLLGHSEGATYLVETAGRVNPPQNIGRARSIRRVMNVGGEYTLDVRSACPITGLNEWAFERDGIFVRFAPSPWIASAQAVYLDDVLYVELQVKDGAATRKLSGTLKPGEDSVLTGKLIESQRTPCGLLWETHRVTATMK